MGPRILLLGRPNVGKSTLFNRLTFGRAITGPLEGLTRDIQEEPCLDGAAVLCDAPGLQPDELMAPFFQKTLQEAELVLFMVDGRAGMKSADFDWAHRLREQSKPVFVVVNKCDRGVMPEALPDEFWQVHDLGFDVVLPISAESGAGCDVLYDAMLDRLKQQNDALETKDSHENLKPAEPSLDILNLALVGRPNVGKSTLMNAFLGYERMHTSAQAGTTRDAIAVPLTLKGRPALLWDTAGLRRKRGGDHVEVASASETLRAVDFAHVVVLVMDATEPLDKGDLKIADYAVEAGKALVLLLNKSDLVDRDACMKETSYVLMRLLPKIRGIKPIFVSAKNQQGLENLSRLIVRTFERWKTHVSTGKLNSFLKVVKHENPPPLDRGKPIALKYITQAKTAPPTFCLFGSRLEALPTSYKTYLINKMRGPFDLDGIPIRLLCKKGVNPYVP